ncbi:UPF0538 protein C2orf76 homolog [Tubulanus polymorphus]|uniref:UPF0538 protein C2orf76 homolog n=1 Tax=Tubulanus polymorphus TaxID=672921 RepID=UPI003DA4B59F
MLTGVRMTAPDAAHGTITVRLIRSFEHRNIKHVIYKHIDFSMTAKQLMNHVNQDIQHRPGLPPPIRKFQYDTMKIQHKAHGAKSNDPVINTENDECLMLKPGKTLSENGVENETEISYFMLADYLKYKDDPHLVW